MRLPLLLFVAGGFQTADGNLLVDLVCTLIPWVLTGFCAENSAAFCLSTPQLNPDVCVEGSSANCPGGLTALDIAKSSTEDLTGKVALVTGGRSGIGFAIVEALLSRGCTVVIASRDGRRNRIAVSRLRSRISGADVSYMTFDLEEFDSVRAFSADFIETHDRLDYYFANAGQINAGGTSPLTVDGYERVFQVNYVSQVLLLELLLPLLRESQPSRVLLNSSFMHPFACNSLGLDDSCFGEDGDALAMLPTVVSSRGLTAGT